MVNIKENENLSKLNHSCAHLLAQAVKHIYKDAKFWVGPVIEEGFYYDIDLGTEVIKEEDLAILEKEMKKIAKDGKRIIRNEISKEEALELFKNNLYKVDLINSIDDEVITYYSQGDFIDLCRGPHIESVKEIKYFKLLKVSGAYYKGDSNNKMLQRVYGIAFENETDLNEHLKLLEEAKARDHRKLGRELGLFMINEYGPGFPFWLPKGMILKRNIEKYWYDEHLKQGYEFINTPIMLNKELWEKSGHWFNYKENMYTSEIENKEFAIKPMNCPGSLLVYNNTIHSYKEFPLRVGELGLVHRHEASGALSGLFRVRMFTQDDAHIYMTEDQVENETVNLIKFFDKIYKTFNLDYKIELSTRPESNYIGTIETWDKAEESLETAIKKANINYQLNKGDGAFYGPKLDFHIKDSLGRTWQCGTIQLDMNLPERFDLTYINETGEKRRPVMLHRAIFGSLERFIGILIEHFAGVFPLWLAPVQINIIPVNNQYHLKYAKNIQDSLIKYNIRCQLDDKDEKLSYKIRESQVKKIPLTLIIGDNEIKDNSITYRIHGSDESITLKLDEFITNLLQNIDNKDLNMNI